MAGSNPNGVKLETLKNQEFFERKGSNGKIRLTQGLHRGLKIPYLLPHRQANTCSWAELIKSAVYMGYCASFLEHGDRKGEEKEGTVLKNRRIK